MRHVIATAIAVTVLATGVVAQRTPLKPTAPGTPGDPSWQAVVKLTDGRRFVTDGGLAVDAALAKPATLPEREVPGKVLESYLSAPHEDECGFNELTPAASGRTYATPGGIPLNA